MFRRPTILLPSDSSQGGLTILGGFSIIQNTILGPGLLGLPWAVAQCGIVSGMILLVLSGLAGLLGMHCLAASAVQFAPVLKDHPSGITLTTICNHINSRFLKAAFDVGLLLACSGALISSLIIIGDSLEHLPGLTRNEWILLVFCCVAGPLSCFRKLQFLRFSSYLSLAMCVYISCLVVSAAFRDTSYFPDTKTEIGKWEANRFRDNGLGILQAIPIFIFCFCGHMNVCSVANELQNLTVARMDAVLTSGLFASGIIYGAVSYGAYSSFGNATPKDLLSFFPQSGFVTAARLGITVVCTAFYPLLVNPIRTVFLGWVMACSPATPSQGLLNRSQAGARDNVIHMKEIAGDEERATMAQVTPAISWVWHWVATFFVGAIALGTALVTKDLGKVFSLSGATGFALLCHVCPAALYLRVVTQAKKRMRVLAGLLGLFGFLVIPICVTANLIK